MDFILCGSILVAVFQTSIGSDYLANETGSGDDAPDYFTSLEYIYEDENGGQYQLCTSDVLRASSAAKVLTLSAENSTVDQMSNINQWTIIPSFKGGVVAITMIEYTVGPNLFTQGCSDIQVFQSELNSSTLRQEPRSWCRNSRLLPCDMSLQMAFHFGYVLTSTAGSGINVVNTPSDAIYDYDSGDKISKMYYYECGGRRTGGDITSPTFPSSGQNDIYVGHVSCKWELRVGKTDYGILRFTRFNLPRCEDHYLLVEEDTIIEEEDVTDSLLKMLDRSEALTKHSAEGEADKEEYGNPVYEEIDSPTEEVEFDYYEAEEKDSDPDSANKYTFFYRKSSDNNSTNDTVRSVKYGVHAVVITKYCGSHHPPRTMYWKRGSKEVTLTFVSENMTSSDQGFEAKYSVFSWEHAMKDHRSPRRKVEKPRKHSVGVDILLNYIVVIVFVPIGVSIGLGIIIFHIKKRGPTIRDFYKKEKKEMKRLQRSKTERVKSPSQPHTQRAARRTQSLDLPQSPLRSRELTEVSEISQPLMKYRPNPVGSRVNSRLIEGRMRQPPVIREARRFPTRADHEKLLPARELLAAR